MGLGSVNVGGGAGSDASAIAYDNSTSGLRATNVQDAITEVALVGRTIDAVPTPAAPLQFNGSSQSPTWNGFDSEKLEISGATSGTNVGEYTALFTPKTGYQWSDGTTAAKSAKWYITVAKLAVPTQSGSLVYNGGSQSPSWNGYDSAKMTIGGTTSGKNATSYNATFDLKDKTNYQWVDGSTTAKNAPWSISKADPVVTPPTAKSNLKYNGSAQTLINAGQTTGGTMQYCLDNVSFVTALPSGTAVQDYTVYYKVAGDSNYNSVAAQSISASIARGTGSLSLSKSSMALQTGSMTDTATATATGTVSAESSDTSIAEVSVSGNVITVTGKKTGNVVITVHCAGNANYTAPADKTISVAVTKVSVYGVSWDGSSTTSWTRTDDAAGFTDPVPAVNNGSGSSPFDNCMPWSGMVKQTESDAGVMVKIPKFWYKITQNGNGMKIQIADAALDGFSVSPAHMNRGDGKGERDYVLIGRYHCASDYKSKTGVSPLGNKTRSDFRTGISNLGSNVWMADWAMRFTLFLLYLVEFANWNTQAKIGKGCGNNSGVQNMGYTDNMQYHTGTSQSSRDNYGLGTQYRWIEGLWDNVRDWIDGCYNSSNGLKIILNPSSASDSSGGVSVGTPSDGYPSKFSVKNVSGTFPLFIPSEASGSDSTYSCDDWSFNASDPCVGGGGYYNQGTIYGLFYFSNYGTTGKYANIGSRSMKLP